MNSRTMIQRPRNRQGSGNKSENGRSRGANRRGSQGRDEARTHGGNRDGPSSYTRNVPTAHQVFCGSPVSIVLKIDQATGNQVQGIVGEVLTRGNHPRGIKVRLRDGRVGRVQRMVSEVVPVQEGGVEGTSNLGRNGEPLLRSSGIGNLRNPHSADARNSNQLSGSNSAPTSSGLTPGAYLPDVAGISHRVRGSPSTMDESYKEEEADRRRGTPWPSSAASGFSSATITCPVCGRFRGDEMAVAHHVNTHFD